MAILIPSLNSCLPKMQPGEKRFARCLVKLLEDDYLCWYEIPVGKRYTDFIILHPLRGLLFLEVKDWKLETIQSMDKVKATINIPTGQKTVSNPLRQARECTYELINKLEQDEQLIHRNGNYQGKLVMPYGYGVVLSNITRKQFTETNLSEVLPIHQVICKDEMQESSDAEYFQKRFWDMFNYQFNTPLSLPQIDRIRWHIFPEIRINQGSQQDFFANPATANQSCKAKDILVPEIVKVMDQQQEQLARSLGNGHRVIHGVAGSGKTLILGYRSVHLAEILDKPILVLCYNITLASRLRQMMIDYGVEDRVNVYHFHDWCGEQLRLYNIEKPEGTNYFDLVVNKVIDSVEQERIPRAQYGAILIDEGHDFKPEWLSLITGMVDPKTDSLLLLYDDAQSIYNDKGKMDFSLSSVGIKARGRTTILRLNYRNTDEITRFAYKFASQYFSTTDCDEDHVPIIQPQSVGAHGPEPVVKKLTNFDDEIRYIVNLFARLNKERSIPWSDMCVTYRNKWMGEKLQLAFINAGIPSQWLNTSARKKKYIPTGNNVKLMTMHSSKGLEFPVVAISGTGYLPDKHASKVDEAKLLYVAMTRSTEKLLLTCHQESEFISPILKSV